MDRIEPDLAWYTGISASKALPPRCPFATADRCPRYYQSLALLGSGGASKIDDDDDVRLKAFWRKTDLWPLTAEQATTVMGAADGSKVYERFCPEVIFQRFGLFASGLFPYPDAEAREYTLNKLAGSAGALSQADYRWDWWRIHELHYSSCPLYSLLPFVPASPLSSGKGDEALVVMKPSFAGLTLNIGVLLTRLARWWLRRQKSD